MINSMDRVYVVFHDNRPLGGVIESVSSDWLSMLGNDGFVHHIPLASIREVVDHSGGPEIGDVFGDGDEGGGGDDPDDDDDDPPPEDIAIFIWRELFNRKGDPAHEHH